MRGVRRPACVLLLATTLLPAAVRASQVAAAPTAPASEPPEVRALAEALATYQRLAAAGGWRRITRAPATAGDRARLCARLAVTADVAPAACGAADPDAVVLADGVRHFQRRHGLAEDGVAGPRTRAALNVPVARRIRALTRTLARWRALPADLGARHVRVNIPDFTLRAYADGREVLAMRVIAGTPRTRTPSFSAVVRALVVRPTWYVPARIRDEELAPAFARDPALVQRDGFEVYAGQGEDAPRVDPAAVDWSGDVTGLELRQPPGPRNPLGTLKFDLPNPYEVYLHATPFPERFIPQRRAFSHGCIRLQDPVALALFALDGDPAWPSAQLETAMADGPTRWIWLSRPLPVYVTYFTAAVVDGVVHFRPDVYGRD